MPSAKRTPPSDCWIALLRGINVGGKTIVSMAELRALMEKLGYRDVETYIQSGNAIFRAGHSATEATITSDLRRAVERGFKRPIGVVVRPQAELVAALKANPFPRGDPARVLIVFCDGKPKGRLDPARSPGDETVIRGREVYLHCPNGAAKTRFTLDYLERALGVTGTARNVRTVATLAAWGLKGQGAASKRQL